MAKSGPKCATRFTPEVRAAFLDKIRTGGKRMASARAVGVHVETVQRAMRRDSELTAFGHEVLSAEMEANDAVVNALWKSAVVDRNVTAQQVWLYNRLPDEWRDMRSFRGEIVVTDDAIEREHRRLLVELEELDRAGAEAGTTQPPGGAAGSPG